MTSERWRQIERVYHAALEHEPQARADYVEEACLGDQELRKEVESLLAQDASSPGLIFNRAPASAAGLSNSAPSRLAAGARVGPYEVESQLGAGGMAEVWRARDLRLGRLVALKVSRTDFSRRFELEARAVAALNHPHICTLYDVGPNYLVMECVNGRPLQELIPRKGLPVKEALNYAVQIADAVAAAHAAGIVHRDLKPGNILVTAEGNVKVVDFGLARVAMPDAHNPDDPNPLTAKGEIVGTVSYMSPEQAEGRTVDARSDIFSFGSVLYEMCSGVRAFRGSSLASTLAEIIHTDPRPVREIAAGLPRDLETLLRRCLRKDPARRWQSMADLKVALLDLKEDPAAEGLVENGMSAARGSRPLARPGLFAWTLAGGAILTAAALAFIHFREPTPERQPLQFTLPLPQKTSDLREFALSPDGRYVVMDAGGDGIAHRLWLRPMDALQAQPLAGTEEATYPFWSPDSRWIAFFAGDKLKKIPAGGGPVQTVCDAPIGRGGAWGRSGVIVFAANNGNDGLSRVADTGGAPSAVTKVELGTHRWPWFLPDGRHFLYLAIRGKSNGIHLASLDSGQDRRLVPDESNPAYAPPGLLLFIRERTLMGQAFDPNAGDVQGQPFVAAEQVARGQDYGSNLYSLSESGVLAYERGSGSEERRYVWFDRTGKEVGRAGGAMRGPASFSLSPNGKRLAVERPADSGSGTDLWLTDLEHVRESRLTFVPSLNSGPVWSPDGSRIAFESNRGDGNARLYQRLSNNSGSDELLLETQHGVGPVDWSRDGRYIIVRSVRGPTDLWAFSLSEKKAVPLVTRARAGETDGMGQLSPDGRWLAYITNASGLFQVMVQAFAPALEHPLAAQWQISATGGTQPRWRSDGKELYFMAPDGRLTAVEVNTMAQSFEHGTPQPLFASPADAPTGAVSWTYVPNSDGKRFLIRTPASKGAESPAITVVVNWLASAKR